MTKSCPCWLPCQKKMQMLPCQKKNADVAYKIRANILTKHFPTTVEEDRITVNCMGSAKISLQTIFQALYYFVRVGGGSMRFPILTLTTQNFSFMVSGKLKNVFCCRNGSVVKRLHAFLKRIPSSWEIFCLWTLNHFLSSMRTASKFLWNIELRSPQYNRKLIFKIKSLL